MITEGRQVISHDASWQILKWDESDEFSGSMERSFHGLPGEGVKAADAVGVRHQPNRAPVVLVAEFKDPCNPAIPPQHAATAAAGALTEPLMRDVIRKVIDTLAGATFAHDVAGARCQELSGWRPALGRPTTRLLVLICMEVPPTQRAAVGPWTTELKKRLRWLGPNARALVTTSDAAYGGNGLSYGIAS